MLALIGMFFAIGGATIDTASRAPTTSRSSSAGSGGNRRPRDRAAIHAAWLSILLLALVIAETGIDPVLVTEYSVISPSRAAAHLPADPAVANDEDYMGEHRNGRIANALGWTYFGIIIVIAMSAIP